MQSDAQTQNAICQFLTTDGLTSLSSPFQNSWSQLTPCNTPFPQIHADMCPTWAPYTL